MTIQLRHAQALTIIALTGLLYLAPAAVAATKQPELPATDAERKAYATDICGAISANASAHGLPDLIVHLAGGSSVERTVIVPVPSLSGRTHSKSSSPVKTFPAFLPLRPLDRIYFRGPLAADHCFVSRTHAARRASDHLPLVADFILS